MQFLLGHSELVRQSWGLAPQIGLHTAPTTGSTQHTPELQLAASSQVTLTPPHTPPLPTQIGAPGATQQNVLAMVHSVGPHPTVLPLDG